MKRTYQKKEGRYGTLYLFRVKYSDPDPACPTFSCKVWAYDEEAARLRFEEGEDGDGWRIEKIEKVEAR